MSCVFTLLSHVIPPIQIEQHSFNNDTSHFQVRHSHEMAPVKIRDHIGILARKEL